MVDVMFDAPSREGISRCVIDGAVIRGEAEPQLLGETRKAQSFLRMASMTEQS